MSSLVITCCVWGELPHLGKGCFIIMVTFMWLYFKMLEPLSASMSTIKHICITFVMYQLCSQTLTTSVQIHDPFWCLQISIKLQFLMSITDCVFNLLDCKVSRSRYSQLGKSFVIITSAHYPNQEIYWLYRLWIHPAVCTCSMLLIMNTRIQVEMNSEKTWMKLCRLLYTQINSLICIHICICPFSLLYIQFG